jgi:hypothetical protein
MKKSSKNDIILDLVIRKLKSDVFDHKETIRFIRKKEKLLPGLTGVSIEI